MADYHQGLMDGQRLITLAMAAAFGEYRTGLRDYPICRTERGRAAHTELAALKAEIAQRLAAVVIAALKEA